MSQYMADIELPDVITDEFASLIPFQRAKVNELMSEGKIAGYSLSMDRTRLWVVLTAGSVEEARSIVASFPIFPFIQFKIHELMFHNSVRQFQPHFSLN